MNFESLGIKSPVRKAKKRVGRGPGSGSGLTCGTGHKGQKSRGGYSSKPGFEGGQMPLIRRLPKRGFTNIFKKNYQIVNIGRLNQFDDKAQVNPETLKEKNIIKNIKTPVKILGSGELNKTLTVQAHAFSNTAKETIEKAGGQVKEL